MSLTNEIWLAIRTDLSDGDGDGTPLNPYAVNTPASFAAIMGDATKAKGIIRLGPGIFRTCGGGGNGVVSVGQTAGHCRRVVAAPVFGVNLGVDRGINRDYSPN